MPKISVLMSVYNGEKYLREAIDGVLNQSFRDFEFIIINDGSTDLTKDIILSYQDPRIIFMENKENIYLTKSLNNALKIARGKYIARIDADTVPMNNWLEEKLNFLEKNPDIYVLGSWLQNIDINSGQDYIIKYEDDPDIIKWGQIFKNQIAHSSTVFKKDIIDKMGPYNEKYRFAQDFDFWFRVSRKYKMTNLPKVLAQHRLFSDSAFGNPDTRKIQEGLASEVILNSINYYIDITQKDFEIFLQALKNGRILKFENFILVRKIYNNLFSSYIKKEGLDNGIIKKIFPEYKRKKNSMFKWYLKCKFPKIYNLCKNLFKN